MRGACGGWRRALAGAALLVAFVAWTIMVDCVDVQPVGQAGTDIGFATLNVWFHGLTGVHMGLYVVTDWLGLVPIAVCLGFGVLGMVQLVRRRSVRRVDADLILLGVYYVLVIFCYLLFEKVVINYRPIPIDGVMEASYPSSHALLVLSVMPTLGYGVGRRASSERLRRMTWAFVVAFSAFMVIGRLVSGVHWATDIVGSVLLAAALFTLYQSAVACVERRVATPQGRG